MKQKISISINEKTLEKIENELQKGLFRSKSHLIDYAVMKFVEGDNDG